MEADSADAAAFCPLLWEANGGNIGEDGQPSETNWPVRGTCMTPWDCFACEIMQSALMNLAAKGVTCLWICPACVALVTEIADDEGITIKLPGFYTEGFCQRSQCYRAETFGEQARHAELLQLLTVLGNKVP